VAPWRRRAGCRRLGIPGCRGTHPRPEVHKPRRSGIAASTRTPGHRGGAEGAVVVEPNGARTASAKAEARAHWPSRQSSRRIFDLGDWRWGFYYLEGGDTPPPPSAVDRHPSVAAGSVGVAAVVCGSGGRGRLGIA
jgi:hypothetical protein